MAGPPPDESCGVCRFFIIAPDGLGACRRYPPELLLPTAVYRSPGEAARTRATAHWAPVKETDWCGEFSRNVDLNPQKDETL